ncbi:MAG TPA: glycosyltransferase family 4 protein [Burkholderiales bacterium]
MSTGRADRALSVALVTHYFPAHHGGVERVAGEIAARLAASGAATICWHASDVDPPPAETPGLRCIAAASCNAAERLLGFPYPLWSPRALARVARAAREADVVHLHDCVYLANVVAALAARLKGRPVVVTQHVGRIPYRNPLLRAGAAVATRLLGKLVLGGAAQAVFVSDTVLQEFQRFVRFRRPPLRIANGVDETAFHPLEGPARRELRRSLAGASDVPLLAFAGRFVEKKGLHLVRQLAAALPGVRWLFAGWGPLDPSRWGLANVSLRGNLARGELAQLYQAADLLVLPSVGEGFPLVVQEAMACGTPALVGDETAAAAPEAAGLLLHEPLGRHDDAERWRARIEALLAAPGTLAGLRPRVAAFAREAWSWERAVQRYAQILREAAGDA